ncbi:MAG: PAP2 family protein [Rhodocyclales bacterium]|nr:PAP2 family protein [Rhodocyclales bacterium]
MMKFPSRTESRPLTLETASSALPALLAGMATVAVLLVAVAQYTELDQWLAALYYDPQLRDFPWRNSWFATAFMHGHVKNAIVWLGFLLLGATVLDLLFKLPGISARHRAQLRIVTLAAFLVPNVIKALKQQSSLQCPWSIDRYGGSEPLLRLFDAVPAGWHDGHCFPAGHASSGMWLIALAVFWLPTQPRRAFAAYLAGLTAGMALGWVQQMRGAHFLTHTLWTAWIASALLLALIAVFARPLFAAPERQPAAECSGREYPACAAGSAE